MSAGALPQYATIVASQRTESIHPNIAIAFNLLGFLKDFSYLFITHHSNTAAAKYSAVASIYAMAVLCVAIWRCKGWQIAPIFAVQRYDHLEAKMCYEQTGLQDISLWFSLYMTILTLTIWYYMILYVSICHIIYCSCSALDSNYQAANLAVSHRGHCANQVAYRPSDSALAVMWRLEQAQKKPKKAAVWDVSWLSFEVHQRLLVIPGAFSINLEWSFCGFTL